MLSSVSGEDLLELYSKDAPQESSEPGQDDDQDLEDALRVARVCEVRRPQAKLDLRIVALNPESSDFPILRLGYAFPDSRLFELAQRDTTNRFPIDPESPILSDIVECYLWAKCGDLGLMPFEVVWPLSTKRECMISFFSTKNLRKVGKVKRFRVKRALDTLRKELGLGKQRALWYWDFACGPDYTCPLPEYNVD